MSIAWGSLVLLILLLPGVLFFVGLYFPEQFTRETAERSPLGQLAAVLLVSFIVHGMLYGLSPTWCRYGVPCPSLADFLQILSVDFSRAGAIERAATNVRSHRWWIFGYQLFAQLLGIGLGWMTGWIAMRLRMKSLMQHTWIYDLSVDDNLTVAYVMTHIRQDDRILMYQGFLRSFALQRDGRFSYIVLTDAARGYMRLGEDAPTTSGVNEWQTIGGTSEPRAGPLATRMLQSRREKTVFVIEGEDIANAVFDRLAVDIPASVAYLSPIEAKLQAEFDKMVRDIVEAEYEASRHPPTDASSGGPGTKRKD